jgi:DNA-directed RNA polymerase beta' subunit
MQDERKDKKKIAVYIPLTYVIQMEDANLTQTEAVNIALEYYFSEDRQKIKLYKRQILEDEKKILVLEAKLSEFEIIKDELRRAHQTLEDTRAEHQTHVLQVQTLINQLEDKRQIEAPKRAWYKFW